MEKKEKKAKIKVSTSLPESTFKKIETMRGIASRSGFLRLLVEKGIANFAEKA